MQDRVLVIYLPDCHESLCRYNCRQNKGKNTISRYSCWTRGEEGVKGSGRSIEAYHMYEEMTRVRHLFTKYGGHKMAAGLSLEEKDVEDFRRKSTRYAH